MLRRTCVFALAIVAPLTSTADVFPPRATRTITLSSEYTGVHYRVAMNNVGQVVWAWTPDLLDLTKMEILLFDRSRIVQITSNSIMDTWPDINDDGTIVWVSLTGLDNEGEIWIWRDGVSRRLVDGWPPGAPMQLHNDGPSINNLGHVVWSRLGAGECTDAEGELWWYDKDGVRTLTNSGKSNQGAQVNDRDEVLLRAVHS